MKNSNDTIGNRTRDLLACSAVPQPTAPLRTPPSAWYHSVTQDVSDVTTEYHIVPIDGHFFFFCQTSSLLLFSL